MKSIPTPCNDSRFKLVKPSFLLPALVALSATLLGGSAFGASGTWTGPTAVWSGTANWIGGVIADGAGSTADFSQKDITGTTTVTIDGAVASRTVGTLLLGDVNSTNVYTIAATGGGTLTFNNGGSTAILTETATSKGDTISAPIILADNLQISSSSTNAFAISGGITGAKNFSLNANGTGAINLSTGSINNGGTITNSGTGSGLVTISSVIGTNVTGIVQNSAASGLTLATANLFSGSIAIKSGTLTAGNTIAALGVAGNIITLGDTAGGNNAATLIFANSLTYAATPIVLAAATTGPLTIGSGANAVVTGGVTGTNNLLLTTGAGSLSFTTAALNNAGTITNSSTGAGNVVINGGVGSNVTGVIQSSTSSLLTIGTTALTVNSGGTTLTNNNGLKLTVTSGINGTGNLISQNNGATAAGITISTGTVNNIGGILNSGTGTGDTTISSIIGSNVTTVTQNSPTSSLILTGSNSFTGSLSVLSGTVFGQTSAAAYSTGTVLLGATSGTANASLIGLSSVTYANNITVQAGSSNNTLTLGQSTTANVVYSGTLTLNNNLTISVNNPSAGGSSNTTYLNVTGPINGTGNITINGAGGLSTANDSGGSAKTGVFLTGTVATTGTITNVGSGTNQVQITGTITQAAAVNQNSATSLLILAAANTFSGATNVNAGVLIGSVNGFAANSAVTVASGATLYLNSSVYNSGQSLTISGKGSQYNNGALALSNGVTYALPITLAADATIGANGSTFNNALITGTISGSGKTLTVMAGQTNLQINAIATGTGGLIKNGADNLILGGSNSYSGATVINNGAVTLSNANALAGGGNITFAGGALQFSGSNTLDYAGRIVNSTGPIAIDTNGQTVAFAGNLAASNTGGFTKLGSGKLTLSGVNLYSGLSAINNGVLAVSSTSSLPTSLFIDVRGALNSGGAYANVQSWLNSGQIVAGSMGAIALTGNSSENIDFTGLNNLMLGASSNSTYTGTITPAGGLYRLGGGGATLTLSTANTLTGTNGLAVGAFNGAGNSGASVTITGSNNLSGATTINAGTLTLSGSFGSLASSDITVGAGAVLAIADTGIVTDGTTTRAKSVTLNNGTLTVTGVATSFQTAAVTGALTIGAGASIVKVAPTNNQETLEFGSFARNPGGVVLFSGSSLGVNPLNSFINNTANIFFDTAPTLSGAGVAGSTTVGILVGAYGDTATAGSGFGATGGLVTYSSGTGVRLLASAEYKSTITDNQTQLDNVRFTNTAGSGVVTDTLLNATTGTTSINSLSFLQTGTTGLSGVTINGAGTLKINSGVIYANQALTSTAVATDLMLITGTNGGLKLDFNGQEALILTNAGSAAPLEIDSQITNANGLTKAGSGRLTLGGTVANTYSGTTIVNAGTLFLNKTAGLNAIGGDLVINQGATVAYGAANQIADTATVTVNGGVFGLSPSGNNNGGVNETIGNLIMTNGGNLNYGQASGPVFTILGNATISGGSSFFQNYGGKVIVGGTLNVSDSARVTINRSQSPTGAIDAYIIVNSLVITNIATGAYTPISIAPGNNVGQSAGALILNGDLTFIGNNTNMNTTLIDAVSGAGGLGVIMLTGSTAGSRTFNIGDGAAAVDLTVSAALIDGTNGTSSLVKTGLGTLALTGTGSYSGSTAIQNGTLTINNIATVGSAQPLGTSNLVVLGSGSTAGTLQYTGTSTALGQNVTVNAGNGVISNTGGGLLTLSGTLNKTNSTLTLTGGAFNVTGQITGGTTSDFNSDFDVNNATVTVSSTNNNYTGPTVVYNNGTLLNGASNALPTGTVLTTGSSTDGAVTNTYDLNGFNQTVAALNSSGTGTNIVTNSGASGTNTLTVTGVQSGTSGGTTAVSGNFGGTIKDGATAKTAVTVSGGTHTLSGSNSYSANTTITSGTLALASSTSNNNIGNSARIITGTAASSNATLDVTGISTAGGFKLRSGQTLSGYGTVKGNTEVLSGATIAPGGIGATSGGTLSTTGNVTFDSGSTFSIRIGVGLNNNDRLAITGNAALGGTLSLSTFGTPDQSSYTLLTTSGNVTGTFASISGTPSGYTVNYHTNSVTLDLTGAPTTSTTYSLSSTATTTKIFTSGSTSISSTITNTGTGTADTLDYTGLGGSATGGSVSGSTTSGTGLANAGGSATNSGQTYVAGTTSGTFVVNPVGTGTNHTLGTAATLSGSTPVSVSVYDQASLTTSTTTGNQATPANLILTNGTSTGGASGQRAGVTVTGLSASNVQATDNTNNFATPVTTGSAVADAHGTTTSATVGTASVLGKRLNGTYTETITGTTRYTDNTLNGQQSVANQTWNITATVSGNASTSRSDVYTANVLSGKAYGTSNSSGFSLGSNLVSSGHQATTATLLNSSLTASATTNANMSFDKTAANAVANSFRSSDILTLSGLNSTSPISGVQLTDTYVLQLSYDTTATGVQYLGWNNGSQFVNAISGDSTGNTTPYLDGNEVVGAYSGQTTVGTYGYDPTNHVVWAVLNHGGFTNGSGTLIAGTNEFAAIPEPSTWGMILGGFGMLVGFQKLRKRRVGI